MRGVAQFGRFCAVGGAGFLLDATVLQILVSVGGMGLYPARVVSFFGAATLTWFLNRSYTFRQPVRGSSARGLWSHYVGLMAAGAAVNYATYVCCLLSYPLAVQYPALAVAAGSLAGLALNFATARRMFSGAGT